jgi:hypothetical protein
LKILFELSYNTIEACEQKLLNFPKIQGNLLSGIVNWSGAA